MASKYTSDEMAARIDAAVFGYETQTAGVGDDPGGISVDRSIDPSSVETPLSGSGGWAWAETAGSAWAELTGEDGQPEWLDEFTTISEMARRADATKADVMEALDRAKQPGRPGHQVTMNGYDVVMGLPWVLSLADAPRLAPEFYVTDSGDIARRVPPSSLPGPSPSIEIQIAATDHVSAEMERMSSEFGDALRRVGEAHQSGANAVIMVADDMPDPPRPAPGQSLVMRAAAAGLGDDLGDGLFNPTVPTGMSFSVGAIRLADVVAEPSERVEEPHGWNRASRRGQVDRPGHVSPHGPVRGQRRFSQRLGPQRRR